MSRILQPRLMQRSSARFSKATRCRVLFGVRFVTLIACGILSAACNDPATAPYDVGYMTGSLDDAPVTTELHTYNGASGSTSYKIHGAPLKLTFPKKYYAYSTNMDGGPQRWVILYLDGPSLRSMYDVVRERYGVTTQDEAWKEIGGSGLGKNWRRGRYHDRMTVYIDPRSGYTDPMTNSWVWDQVSADLDEKEFSRDEYQHTGELCGFDVYSGGPNAERFAWFERSHLLNKDKSSPVKWAQCDKKTSQCNVFIEYRRFSVSAFVEQSRFCAFMPSFRALPAFLDQHAAYPLPNS